VAPETKAGWPERRTTPRASLPPSGDIAVQLSWWIRALLPYLAAILIIGLLDALTPPPVFAGTLLVVPILAASRADHPRIVQITFAFAMAALIVSMMVAHSAGFSMELWLPNRAIEIVALPGSTFLALLLQRQRIGARRARNRADRARGISEMLSGLIAHDLRAPIATTLQALPQLEREPSAAERSDLIRELRIRLTRSLLLSDAILGAAEAGLERPLSEDQGTPVNHMARGLGRVTRAFEAEAAARGKQIELDLEPLGEQVAFANSVALHQAVTIVLDNAVRYAVPGRIVVRAVRVSSGLQVSVADEGPGLSREAVSEGARMGLDLCRALLRKVGGELEVARDCPDGTTFLIVLPDHITGDPVGPRFPLTPHGQADAAVGIDSGRT
jgi:two-component system, OmpR family, sensor histidine kinase AdeS